MASTDFRLSAAAADETGGSAPRPRTQALPKAYPLCAPWQRRPAAVLGGSTPMTALGSFEFNTLPDSILLAWLTAGSNRPNVLIECRESSADIATRHMMTWCTLPFRYCALPGRLELPTARKGTLLLKDVATMTLSQQVMLYDWLSRPGSHVQVISLATTPLRRLVEEGEFLEGLFYRLNVIRLDALHGTRPAPPDAWQQCNERMA
jgi:hypothetical protein